MTYAIRWKETGAPKYAIYHEYGDMKKVLSVLEFIERYSDEFELIDITPCEEEYN